ncbi:MAG TPA: ATP-binding protein, partial [Deltaproteobacteria bacterium]|nr:ATP-binding protein [Deltaproteobacteria bacterium]
VIRPLLGVTRTEIERYARAEGVESRDDRTNKDTSRARNLIRLEVMPLLLRINPAAVKAMASLAAIAGEEGAVLEELAADAAAVASVARGSLLRAYALDRLQAVCAPVLKRMLIDTVAQVDRGMRGMAMKQVNMLVGVVEGKAAAHEIGRRVRVCSTGGLLCVHRIARPPYYALSLSDAGPCEVFVPETGWTVRVRVPVACPEGRVLRSWMPGDRVRGHKAAGIMAGLGVPEALRPFWPVLATGGCLAAVAEGDPKTGGLVLGRGS